MGTMAGGETIVETMAITGDGVTTRKTTTSGVAMVGGIITMMMTMINGQSLDGRA